MCNLNEIAMGKILTGNRHRDDGCSRRFETSFDLSVGPSESGDEEN